MFLLNEACELIYNMALVFWKANSSDHELIIKLLLGLYLLVSYWLVRVTWLVQARKRKGIPGISDMEGVYR